MAHAVAAIGRTMNSNDLRHRAVAKADEKQSIRSRNVRGQTLMTVSSQVYESVVRLRTWLIVILVTMELFKSEFSMNMLLFCVVVLIMK